LRPRRRENKPMLLDIGAVWCHWCHVMDRESYDDPEIAAIVNEHFIAVKVDRDERPDIDSRYQAAVQAVSGQGGWPLTAFLTPDGKAVLWRHILSAPGRIRASELSPRVAEHCQRLRRKAWRRDGAGEDGGERDCAVGVFRGQRRADFGGMIAAIQTSAFRMFDPQHGGFGQAPKFPHPSALDLLIERYARGTAAAGGTAPTLRKMGHPPRTDPPRTGDDELRQPDHTTLEHMANGGVYDQLAGGFHRYSVDERWVVPHFEKMCYDNSELLKNYVHGYQATGREFFADVARDIIRWMDEWLSDRERGGFYASQDADINRWTTTAITSPGRSTRRARSDPRRSAGRGAAL
jgi:uncharacterized protein